MTSEIEIFESTDGVASLELRTEGETVWASQADIEVCSSASINRECLATFATLFAWAKSTPRAICKKCKLLAPRGRQG